MSVLSTVQGPRQGAIVEPHEQVQIENQECARLVFTLTSEAMYEHEANSLHFRVSPPSDDIRACVHVKHRMTWDTMCFYKQLRAY